MEDWYLERLGHENSIHHLNILLGSREKLTIGRIAGGVVDIMCNGTYVSREHCVLKYIDNFWTIEDLKSTNGVYINGNRIALNTPIVLREKDVLGVGALDEKNPENFVFHVLKNTVKDQNEVCGDLAIVEVPCISASTEHPPTKKIRYSLTTAGDSSRRERDNQSVEVEQQKKSKTSNAKEVSTVSDALNSVGSTAFKRKYSDVNESRPTRQNPLPLLVKTPNLPVDREKLTNDILYRIISWPYVWIEEQKRQKKKDESPPLLEALQVTNCRSLPELSLLPVVAAYDSLESYCSTFTPLMLQELWANICKDVEDTSKIETLEALIDPNPEYFDGFALLECEAMSQTRIYDMDLVSLTVSPQEPPVKIFAVAKRNDDRWKNDNEVDPRLLETRESNVPYSKMSFTLWVKKSCVPQELDKIFTVTKVLSLKTVVKQLFSNAELALSPLCEAILRPNDNVDSFEMDKENLPKNNTALNPCQFTAVQSISRTMVCTSAEEPKIALLHGPPGTGKSRVIVEIILRTMSLHHEKTGFFPRILVCAPSNNAIDEIAKRLLLARDWGDSIIRIGVPDSMHPDVRKISLQGHEENRTVNEPLATRRDLLSHALVICSTLNSCRSKEMEELFLPKDHREKSSFLCCILDEASQCTEPESLSPLAFGISKLVLIGDPHQLPATVLSQVAKKQLFEQSLFNRLCSIRMSPDEKNKEGVTVLKTQYRMAKAICEWPSKYFYDGKLVTAESLIRHGPCNEYRVFNVMDGIEQLADQSVKNEKEADLVANIVRVILESPLTSGKSIGVITFYKSQKQCIIRKLNEAASRVQVNTVDSFQGQEMDIIIISCVRAREALQNFGGGIGFISSKQRINVAITRPKETLIICGHFLTLQTDETWQSLINNAEARHFAHEVSSKSASDDLRQLVMRPTPREQQRMVADLTELSGMKANWSTKFLEDNAWNFKKAGMAFYNFRDAYCIPLEAFASLEKQKQLWVNSFSNHSGMNTSWSLKCLEDFSWDFIGAATAFTRLKASGNIPPQAFLTPKQQQMVDVFSHLSGMNTTWSLDCLRKNDWDHARAALDFFTLNSSEEIPQEAFNK